MARVRLDQLLAQRGLFESRSRAAASVLAGEVSVGGAPAEKPGTLVTPDASIAVAERPRYVSRGAHKLEAALAAWPDVDPAGRRCLDLGASTGGFTDLLLDRGAAHVTCVDVGYGELAWRLREDPRTAVLERTNARHLDLGDLPDPVDLVVADLSFISLRTVLPAVLRCVDPAGSWDALLMVKPQFEVGRDRVGKGGVVRDPALRREALVAVAAAARAQGAAVLGFASSGLLGPKGNRESFVRLAPDGHARAVADLDAAAREVEP